jgi:hypothetical protein
LIGLNVQPGLIVELDFMPAANAQISEFRLALNAAAAVMRESNRAATKSRFSTSAALAPPQTRPAVPRTGAVINGD